MKEVQSFLEFVDISVESLLDDNYLDPLVKVSV